VIGCTQICGCCLRSHQLRPRKKPEDFYICHELQGIIDKKTGIFSSVTFKSKGCIESSVFGQMLLLFFTFPIPTQLWRIRWQSQNHGKQIGPIELRFVLLDLLDQMQIRHNYCTARLQKQMQRSSFLCCLPECVPPRR
jgi:hypothetical protein